MNGSFQLNQPLGRGSNKLNNLKFIRLFYWLSICYFIIILITILFIFIQRDQFYANTVRWDPGRIGLDICSFFKISQAIPKFPGAIQFCIGYYFFRFYIECRSIIIQTPKISKSKISCNMTSRYFWVIGHFGIKGIDLCYKVVAHKRENWVNIFVNLKV